MLRSEASAACSASSSSPTPDPISNERPVCLSSCRAISRRASRSLCWTCPDNRMTIGWEERDVRASSSSWKTKTSSNRSDVREIDTYTRFTTPTGTDEQTTIPFTALYRSSEKRLQLLQGDRVRRGILVLVLPIKHRGLWMV
jgi:hypothetical protein